MILGLFDSPVGIVITGAGEVEDELSRAAKSKSQMRTTIFLSLLLSIVMRIGFVGWKAKPAVSLYDESALRSATLSQASVRQRRIVSSWDFEAKKRPS